jgi:preprotein translocase subunit SecG
MTAIILIAHIVIAAALIFVIVVMQRSEGGGLGIGGGGGGGGMGNFMTGRSTANFFTRTTAILAGLFMISSFSLTILENRDANPAGETLVDQLRQSGTPGETPAPAPAPESAPGTPRVE